MLKTTKIGNVCDISSGNSIPVKEKESLYKNASDGLPYVATKDIGFDGIINYQNGVRIPIKYSSKFKISKKNSTFVCGEGGSAGKKLHFLPRTATLLINFSQLLQVKKLYQSICTITH